METADNTDRRRATDRRTAADRRRGGEGKRVVVHLGRSQLRAGLTVSETRDGGDLLRRAAIDWRGDAPPLPSDDGFAALAAGLKELVARERLTGCPTSLVLHGELCVTRITTGPTPVVDKALDAIDERSQLYLSLGVGNKVLATSRTSLDARHECAVISVACERTIEGLIDAVNAAGLDLRVIEAEAVALARAHGALHPDEEEPAIVVQFDDDGFEIALTHRGSLLLDYRPGGVVDTNVLDVLTKHHARLERFCQRQLLDYGAKLTRVYLAGQPERVREAERLLSSKSSYTTRAIDVGAARGVWGNAPDDLGSADAVLLGRLLSEVEGGPDATGPNLMARWIAESRKHIRPMLIRSAMPLVATLLVAAMMVIANTWKGSRGRAVESELAGLLPSQAEYKGLNLRMVAASEKLERLKRLESTIAPAEMTALVDSLARHSPDEVWTERLSVSDLATARLSGVSYSESGVYEFAKQLNLAPAFEEIALEGTGVGHTELGPATSFDLKFSVVDPTQTAQPKGSL